MAAILALVLHLSGALASGELLVRDAILRGLPPKPAARVAVVLIDEEALRSSGPWPWDRSRLGQLVDGIFAAEARGVVVDLLTPEERTGDDRLALALAKGPSALAAGVDDEGHWLLPNQVLKVGAVGHVSFDLDRDGVVRRFSSTKQVDGRTLPALPVAAARLGNPQLPIPVNVILRPAFRTRPVPVVSAASILGGRRREALRGRVVFIGTSAAGIGDRFISPVSKGGSPEPGVLIEALSTEAILSKDLLGTAPPLITAFMALGLGLLGNLLLTASARAQILFVPMIAVAPFLLSAASLQVLNTEMAPLAAFSALLLAGAAAGADRSRRTKVAMGDARHRIAELEHLQESIAEARMQNAEAQRVVAHELKTPLTSVKGLAQLLAQFDLSPSERNRVAQMVVSETARLAQMVDALLDLERLRLRNYDRDAQPLDFSALCTQRVEVIKAGTPRKIEVDLAPGLWILGDKALLDRVIENLVSNAFKFSPEGTPVRFSLGQAGFHAMLEIEDQGSGVPVEERTRIFGRFARGSAQGLAMGLGLGLALVAEVVTWHRGSVEADDGPHGGGLFRVRLPLTVVGGTD
ncbi:MAG: CHASE2 domain-containing protein [Acidobacteria bacterium]|nr:CHASE2 domain-containing protein [Acidobacteriota bacterium]